MKVRYTEGAAAVLLSDVGRVKRGEWVTVSEEAGRRLLEQNWETQPRTKKQSSNTKKKKDSGATPSPSETPATAPTTKED